MGTYAELLARKAQLGSAAGFDPLWTPDFLFAFQRMLTGWAIRQGRGALFADCGARQDAPWRWCGRRTSTSTPASPSCC